MTSIFTLKSPYTATTEVAVVEQVQSHLQGSWKSLEFLIELHGSLDEHAFLNSQVKICCPILVEIISNVLGLGNPWQIFIIQLDWSKLVPCTAVECHAHGFALPRVWVSAEDQVVVLGMLLADADHLLEPLDRCGHNQDVICIGNCTKEVCSNCTAIATSPERLKHWIKISIKAPSWAEDAPLSSTIGDPKGI